jgi:hypothetical protein
VNVGEAMTLGMISSGIKTLPIWTKNIIKGIGGYTKTWQLSFNPRLSNIQIKMFSSSNKVKSMASKCHSPLASKHQFNVNQCFHVTIMVLFQWMPHLAPMT